MRLTSTVSVLLTWAAVAVAQDEVRNVAIIGAGAAGASAAYHLNKYATQERLPVNITVFEKMGRIGGRTLTVPVHDAGAIEVGASIFVSLNQIMFNATREFDLRLTTMTHPSPGDMTAIWDGTPGHFTYQGKAGDAWWRDAAKLTWKYGLSPYRANRLVKATVDKFLALYSPRWFPFASLGQRVGELGLSHVVAVTGEEYLEQNKIRGDFSREIIQAATRVNYASNLAFIHGLETMVSFSTDGAVSVEGGNWQIFDRMIRHSGAALHCNTSVTSISATGGGTGSRRRYSIATTASGTAANERQMTTLFDSVIIASPWQFSDIKAGPGVLDGAIDEVPYTKLHVTLFASPFALHPGFFGMTPGSMAPSNVYTTLGRGEEPREGAEGVGGTGFYSVSTLRTVTNVRTGGREFVYKVFSPRPVTAAFLSSLLGAPVPESLNLTSTAAAADLAANFRAPALTEATGSPSSSASSWSSVPTISWFHARWFWSYPLERPRVTFQDPVIGDSVYYTSGMESFISTMETSALMGMNVARLLADELTGRERGTAEQETDDGPREL